MQKQLTPLTLAGVSLAPLLAIAEFSRANETPSPEPPESEISGDLEGNFDEEIPPEKVAIATPPEQSHPIEKSLLQTDSTISQPAQTLGEAPWLLESLTPTVEFSDRQENVAQGEALPQPSPPETAPIEFTPRFGVGYTTSDGGYDSLTSIQGFLPLQTSSRDLFFLEGNWQFDNGNNDRLEGLSAMLGFRSFDPKGDRIWGGYVAYDKRTTDFSVFHQLGLGFETLGDVDFRINGYIPLGQSRNLYAKTSFDTGTQYTDLYFRDRYLMYDTSRTFGETRFYEAALGGFDAELGVKLLSFGEPGHALRLYGGTYYYSGEGITPTWGWRARLEARPTDTLNLGLSLQKDDLFGTNLSFRIGASFPSHRRKRKLKENETNLPRLADSVRRNPTIAVTPDIESETTTVVETEVLAKNPVTGQPWVFRHVTLGATGGDGTFERPYGTIQEGLDTSLSDGNYIVYADIGADLDIPGFSIPDAVQVLSRGPVQPLDTIQFGAINIPLSGTGQYPTIRGTTVTDGSLTGMVALGTNSTLSGFDLPSRGNNGIVGNNATGAIVRDNFISNASNGLHLLGDGGSSSATIFRNSITNVAQTGIRLEALNGGAIAPTTVRDNRIATAENGLSLLVDNATGSATFANNSISNVTQAGIQLEALNGGTLSPTTVRDNRITTANDGILLQADSGTITQTIISDNSIHNATNMGINFNANNSSILRNTQISRNTIATIEKEGISIWATNNSSLSNLVISDNHIRDIFNPVKQSSDAVEIAVVAGATASNIVISNNTISNVGDDGIAIATLGLPTGVVVDGLTIANNIISDVGFDSTSGCGVGIEIANNDPSDRIINNISLLNNHMIRNQHAGIAFDSGIAGKKKPGGTFNVIDFAGNSSIDPQSNVDLMLRVDNSAVINFLTLGNINTGVANLNNIKGFSSIMNTNNNANFDINRRINNTKVPVCPTF
ncbi:MAG: right-handed parallel beta-helix repeat-containing protein [Spirulina sp.]